ncbi:MAG TPA: glucose-6-phosphate isomerase, partial [Opitutus sp.]|nr:glucose-6-phosphate isomerase [Opitutus sp.]
LVGINAYHQPGVEAGKKAAGSVIALKKRLVAQLQSTLGAFATAEEIAEKLGADTSTELVFKILEHLAANRGSGVKKRARAPWYQSRYGM